MFQGTGFGGGSAFGSSGYKGGFNTTGGSVFGSSGGSLFGATTQSSAPGGSLFGATPAFGQTQPQQTSFGGFTGGTSTAGTTSLFGSQQNANTTGGGLFNSTPFGQNKPAFGSFGGTQPSAGLFQQSSQPLFGQPQQSTGLFGSPTAGGFGSGGGGTQIKFSPVTGTDTMVKNGVSSQISTRHHCITCMKEYDAKSLEELRLEDYAANRKGPQQGGGGGSLFGSSATGQQGSSLFGAPSTPQSTGLFGTTDQNKSVFGTPSSGFGSTNTTMFGASGTNAGGSLFNKPAASATPFGVAPTATPTSNFGFNTSNNLFGSGGGQQSGGFFSNTSQASTGFATPTSGFTPFGTTQQQGGLFSQNKPNQFSLSSNQTGLSFGSTAPTSSTLTPSFGANKTFGGFGTAATSGSFGAFGQPAANQNPSFFSTNNTFTKPAGTTPGFQVPFGQSNATNILSPGLSLGGGSLFGGQTGTTGQTKSLFNTPQSGGSLFGSGPSLFNTATSSSGLNSFSFGSNSLQQNTSLLPSFGQHTMAPQNNALNQYMLALASMPFGDSPLFKNLALSPSKAGEEGVKSPAAQRASHQGNHKIFPRSDSKVKIIKPNSIVRNSLFEGLDEDEVTSTVSEGGKVDGGVRRLNPRRLLLKPISPPPSADLSQLRDSLQANDSLLSSPLQDANFTRLVKNNLLLSQSKLSDNILDSSSISDPFQRRQDGGSTSLKSRLDKINLSSGNTGGGSSPGGQQSERTHQPSDPCINTSTSSSGDSEEEGYRGETTHPAGIVLTRAGYYTIPSLQDLARLVDSQGRCIVDNFTIGRLNYGNVFYPDSFNVANLNLDKIVHFRHKEVVIYPEDEEKPMVGQSLNRRAQVTLDRVWPLDKHTRQPITDPARLEASDFEAKLRHASAKHNTRFIEYRPQTGSWVFKVDHFSKYGLTDSDEEDSGASQLKRTKSAPSGVMPNKECLGGKEFFPSKLSDQKEIIPEEGHPPKYLHHKAVMEGGEIEPLSEHIFLDDEDEEMADGPLDLYEMEGASSLTSKLSCQLGTSAHKLQLMKASFFDQSLNYLDGDEREGGGDMTECYLGQDSMLPPVGSNSHYLGHGTLLACGDFSRIKFVPPQLLSSPKHQDVKMETDEVDTGRVGEIGASEKLVFYPCSKVSEDLAYEMFTPHRGLAGHLADLALSRGLAFKPCWGPPGLLTMLAPDFHLQVASLAPLHSTNTSQVNLVEHLEGALSCSLVDDTWAKCENGVTCLNTHLSIARRQTGGNQTFLDVFSLCHALWGHLPDSHDGEEGDYMDMLTRRDALSNWLELVSTPLADKDPSTGSNSPSAILSLMSCHRVIDACRLAISTGDKRLSMLLSQSGGGRVVRALASRQLAEWRETEADKHIDQDRLRLYMLPAGLLIHTTSQGVLEATHSFDWLRTFALHHWYVCWRTSSVKEALDEYDQGWKEKGMTPPFSPHHSISGHAEVSHNPSYSLLYHLLKLYSDRSHPLESLLDPDTHTSDPLDYSLSWFLMRVLTGLGYSHLSEHNTCLIHTSFASQLEALGLWHWAAFVLLHINSDERERLVRELLERHEMEDDKEAFLLNRLRLPLSWIASSKAVFSLSHHRYEEAARNLLDADDSNYAYEVIMKHLVSEAIVNDDYEKVEGLLTEVEEKGVEGWIEGGGFHLLEVLRALRLVSTHGQQAAVSSTYPDLPLSSRIYSSIQVLPSSTPLDRLTKKKLMEALAKAQPEVPLELCSSQDGFSIHESLAKHRKEIV